MSSSDPQRTPTEIAPSVSIITLFHQRRGLARDFLAACEREQATGSGGVEWIFGDSDSTDGTRELLTETAQRWARVHLFGENVGFARGNNALAAQARGEILIFLNYDTGFAPGWLEELVRPFTGRPQLGIVGNVQLSVRSKQPDHAGIFFGADGSPCHFRPSLAQLARLDLLPVPAVTGACLAIRRDLFEAIGGFHESYRTSYEDIELCIQARRRGAEVAVATRSVIWHYIGASPGRQDNEVANARLFSERCGPQARSLARFVPPELPILPSDAALIQAAIAGFDTLQVYYDRGEGFEESNSTVHLVHRGRWTRVEIPLAPWREGSVMRVRLDSGSEPGRAAFSGMSVKAGPRRKTLAHIPGRSFATEAVVSGSARRVEGSRGLEIESNGGDPQVTLDLSHILPPLPGDAAVEIWLRLDSRAATPSTPPRAGRRRSWREVLSRHRVLVDLIRLSPGGLNGGVKVLVLEMLEAVARRQRFRLKVHVLAHPEVCREIARTAPSLVLHPATSTDSPAAAALARTAHVLYAPLGFSTLSRSDLPQVSLLVDLLHRDIDGALPDVEVATREKWLVETLCRSDVLQCNSQFVVDRLHHHYGRCAANLVVVYNAVGLSMPQIPAGVSSPPYFLYPANDWPHKNHDRLLAAYARYRRQSREPWDLKLSGHFADPGRIARSIEQWGASSGVSVFGHVPGPEFSRLFRGASALVFPSRYEGFGIPVLEAFRLEVPVICSRAASLPEVGGEACGYFDSDDPDAIAAAMKQIAEDAAWRDSLIAAGRARARAFTLSRESDKLADAFLGLALRR